MTRQATQQEIKAYEKVENALTMEETNIIFDEMAEEKTFDNLVHNKVTNDKMLEIIKAHNITARELSDWYFTEVEETL